MRIVQAVGWYFPEALGGTEVYVHALARQLRAAGHDILVAAPEAGSTVEREYEHDGLRVYRYPIPAEPNRAEVQELVPVRGAERFHAWLRRVRPELVHVHTFVTGLGLHEVTAAAAAGARVVVTTHAGSLGYLCQRGTMMRCGRELCDGVAAPAKCASCVLEARGVPSVVARAAARVPPLVGSLFRSIPGRAFTAASMTDLIARNADKQRELLERVRAFVVLTDWAAQAAIANGAPRNKIVVNRLGVAGSPAPKPGPAIRPTVRPVRIGYVGRYDPIKGVLDCARALAALPPDVAVEAELRGPMRSAADREIADRARSLLGGDPRFEVGAEVAPERLSALLAGFDVVCCASVCLEGGPTVALEAHAVGTPVVGTRIGGLAEIVRPDINGALVEPGDWRALSALFARIAAAPDVTVDRWRRDLDRPRTMEAVARDYLEVYAA
jgi:glycosyltransferase involved in cell wall biosynthesis